MRTSWRVQAAQLAQDAVELIALLAAQRSEDLLAHGGGHLATLAQHALALWRELHRALAAVAGAGPPFREPARLPRVERGDHRAGVHARVLADRLLRDARVALQHVQHAE